MGESDNKARKGSNLKWLALAGVALLVAGVVYAGQGEEKASDRGGQRFEWSPQERDKAADECRRQASAYGESTCRVSAFCKCAVANYEMRGSYRGFLDIAAPVAAYVRKGQSGYFCTSSAASTCGEPE